MSRINKDGTQYLTQPAIGLAEGLLVIHGASGSFEGQIEVFVRGLANKGAFNISAVSSALLSEIAEHVKAHEGPFYGQLYQRDNANIVFRLLDRGGKIVFKHTLPNTGAK